MNLARGYIFSRPFMGERVPQHIQNQLNLSTHHFQKNTALKGAVNLKTVRAAVS